MIAPPVNLNVNSIRNREVSFADMGRMIDPYLPQNRTQHLKWWCFYKQNGICMYYPYDLTHLSYFGKTPSGENPSVLYKNGKIYFILLKMELVSKDLERWKDWPGIITLGQNHLPWAKSCIMAGTALVLTADKRFGCYLLFSTVQVL